MQACARIGATTRWCSAASPRKSLRDRIEDAGAVAVLTCRRAAARRQAAAAEVDRRRGAGAGRLRHHQERGRVQAHRRQYRLERSRATCGCTSWWSARATTCEPEWVECRAPAVPALYLGLHRQAQGRAALHRRLPAACAALTTKWTFDLKPDDTFWCTADIGWVTGHTYIAYGPLALGGTEIVFEGVPTYPDAGRFWEDDREAQGQRSSTPHRRRSAR